MIMNKLDKIRTENARVTKANELVRAHYRLTLLEQKFILIMASQIQPHDTSFKFYQIHTNDLIEQLGLSKYKGAHHLVRNLVSNLMDKRWRIVVDDPKTKIRGEMEGTWVSSCVYRDDHVIDFEFSTRLVPYLLQLKESFTTYKLSEVLPLKSIYSIRIYELLKQFEKIGYYEVSIENLRSYLELSEGQYVLYGHLKSRIIEPARKELDRANSDIHFDYEEVKVGKKVVFIKFLVVSYIEPKHEEEGFPELILRLRTAGISQLRSEEIWRKRWDYLHEEALASLKKEIENGLTFEDYLTRQIELLQYLQKKEAIQNPGGWLKKAIEENWTNEATLQAYREQERQKRMRRLAQQRKYQESSEVEKQKSSLREIQNRLRIQFRSLPLLDQNSIDEEARQQIQSSAFFKKLLLEEEKKGIRKFDDMSPSIKFILLDTRYNIMQSRFPKT